MSFPETAERSPAARHIAAPGGKPNEYYLRYFGSASPGEWRLVLPGRGAEALRSYRADIIDTWNMTVTPVEGLFRMAKAGDYEVHDPARPTIKLPRRPYMAVRLRLA